NRNKSGRLIAITHRDDPDAITESVMQIQIGRQSRPAVLKEIEGRLRRALADVDAAVSDWRAMSALVEATRDAMPEWATKADPELLRESQEFLSWLNDDHFIFLGARDYVVRKGKKGFEQQIVRG